MLPNLYARLNKQKLKKKKKKKNEQGINGDRLSLHAMESSFMVFNVIGLEFFGVII